MLKKSLLALTVASSIFVGCSSSPTDAKGVAIKVCEAAKKMEFASIKEYAVPSLHAKIDQAAGMLAMLDALPAEQKKEALAKMEKIDCSTMTITDGADGIKEARMAGEQKAIKLKQVDGVWKISTL